MGCFDIFCALCGGPLNTGDIWDSLRSPDPKPGGSYWDYNQNLLCDEDLIVSLLLHHFAVLTAILHVLLHMPG